MAKIKLPNKLYDVLKYLLLIFVPALIVLIGRLGEIWGFDAAKTIETIASIAVFLGAITGISCINYKKDNTTEADDEIDYLEETDDEEDLL